MFNKIKYVLGTFGLGLLGSFGFLIIILIILTIILFAFRYITFIAIACAIVFLIYRLGKDIYELGENIRKEYNINKKEE